MQSEQLLVTLAQQLKVPLLQIARRAELASTESTPDISTIQSTAEAALRLVDSYVLSVKMAQQDQQALVLEPVSVASVLYDTAEQLSASARFYGVELQLSIGGKYAPVQANRQGLQAALTSLGMALIEALPTLDAKHLTIQLGAHRSRYGIVAGLYSDTKAMTIPNLQRAKQRLTTSQQPLVATTHSSGAGLLIADALLEAMQLRLQSTRHQRLFGLGAVLQPNNQLQLI